MQMSNLVVCDTSKSSMYMYMYKQIKPLLVGEHAFPLTGFVCERATLDYIGGGRCVWVGWVLLVQKFIG